MQYAVGRYFIHLSIRMLEAVHIGSVKATDYLLIILSDKIFISGCLAFATQVTSSANFDYLI